MSHINVASTKALLGTYFGNIDAGNWSLTKEQLVLVPDGADHLVPLKTASIVPAMLRLADFTKGASLTRTTIVKTAKAHLRMCVAQATYDMVKELPVHEQWAKLESSFAATSSTVDHSTRQVPSRPLFLVTPHSMSPYLPPQICHSGMVAWDIVG
ncbi:BQ5605_C006g03923 [Microbotryum silenes-dioicae]|uniref:BQ5605_C006g03923 protein n=1 Tax=Microbotryum silenes-dioicae TaxID=796604 RepID=A0A2X0M9L0_9BASI|nr:BQ5605_C006g03923 [Microbotryum silenes-dioicae]